MLNFQIIQPIWDLLRITGVMLVRGFPLAIGVLIAFFLTKKNKVVGKILKIIIYVYLGYVVITFIVFVITMLIILVNPPTEEQKMLFDGVLSHLP